MTQAKVAIAELVYDAAKETLQGTIGSALPFDMKAFSGGSRGHAKATSAQAKLYQHSKATSMLGHFANTPTVGHGTTKAPFKQRGGTLPPGHYMCQYLQKYKKMHECIKLHRQADTHIHYATSSLVSLDNRDDGFFIHGSGVMGSDGCIVPADTAERHRLNLAVKNFHGFVILRVKNVAYLLPAEREGVRFA